MGKKLSKRGDGKKLSKKAQKRPANSASATNSKTTRVYLVHGGDTEKFLTARLDRRSIAYKLIEGHKAVSRKHLGDDLSAFEERHIELEARHSMLENVAFMNVMKELQDAGTFNQPAFDAFNKTSREAARLRETLGLKAKVRDITLSDVLKGEVHE